MTESKYHKLIKQAKNKVLVLFHSVYWAEAKFMPLQATKNPQTPPNKKYMHYHSQFARFKSYTAYSECGRICVNVRFYQKDSHIHVQQYKIYI